MYRIEGNDKTTRLLILLFVFSLLFDGVFRKWFLVPFSTQLMMIKQVLAILICVFNVNMYMEMTRWEKSIVLIGILAFLTTLMFGHHNITVAIYGCLPLWFGMPLCFIIGRKLQSADIVFILKLVVYAGLINSVLMILQFNVSPSHILNFTGGDENAGLSTMMVSEMAGTFRPSGLFVYNTHSNLFMLTNFSIVLYMLVSNTNIINRKLIFLSLILELFACVCSASRTCIMLHIGVFVFFLFYCIGSRDRSKMLNLLVCIIPMLILLTFSKLGSSAINNVSKRFDEASRVQYGKVSTSEGTLNDIFYRNIWYNVDAVLDPHTIDGNSVPFWGYGQGMSTQIGGKLLNVKSGRSGFALAEWDGLRIMCESGYILGWLILFIRLGYVFRFIPHLAFYKKENQFLTLSLFLPFLLSFYLLNTWGNVFLANYAFFAGGLFLSVSMKEKQINNFILRNNEN